MQKQQAQGLERISKRIFEFFWFTEQSSGVRGSPGGSSNEILKLDFSKNRLTRIEGSSESQSKDRGVKDPSTTRWRRGPVRHTAKLVKVFAMSRLDFGQGVWKGDSYRQLALIPTCDAPDLTVH